MRRVLVAALFIAFASSRAPADELALNQDMDTIKVDVPVSVTRSTNPAYPDSAKKTGLEGTVYVQVFVDTAGMPTKAKVVKSDNALFDRPSLDAIRSWRFTPAQVGGKPVGVWVTVPFKYKLEKGVEKPEKKKVAK